jgi:hypothetical protein
MSVVDRLEDALLMMQHQRMDGALHSVLTAIAGASRHRYPRGVAVSRRNPPQRMGDHEAFETFLEDQFGLTKTPRMRVKVDDIDRTFSSVLYELFRCSLAHEAALTDAGRFIADRRPGAAHFELSSIDPLGFTISHTTVIVLADLVARAPEHAEACADVRTRIMRRLPQPAQEG